MTTLKAVIMGGTLFVLACIVFFMVIQFFTPPETAGPLGHVFYYVCWVGFACLVVGIAGLNWYG